MGIVEGPFQNVTSLFSGITASDLVVTLHSGSISPNTYGGNILFGNLTIYLTLINGTTWAAFDATIKQALADGFSATASPANGFNDLLEPLSQTTVTRSSDTQVIVVFPPAFDYDSTLTEVIDIEIPNSALSAVPDNPLTGTLNISGSTSVPAGAYSTEVSSLTNPFGRARLTATEFPVTETVVDEINANHNGTFYLPEADIVIDAMASNSTSGSLDNYEFIGGSSFTDSSILLRALGRLNADPALINFQIEMRICDDYTNIDKSTFWTDRGVVNGSLIHYLRNP